MRRTVFGVAVTAIVAWSTPSILGFCGFYVAKADTKLFNKASQVVLVRDGDRTVMTMANDFEGEPKEFAIVIPVPTFLKREQIHVGEKALVDHLDAYSAPRLVEYFDSNPCERLEYRTMERLAMPAAKSSMADQGRANALGVTIEAQYTVGEYDIVILSAQQSSGLETWLQQNGYRIPPGASPVIGTYLKQNMRFFVAKVNLAEHSKLGFSYLRPLQVAYESPKFMLPIRLGMVNAKGNSGPLRLCADPQRPCRDDELSDGETPGRRGAAGLFETAERVCCVLQGDVRATGRRPGWPGGVSRIRLGHAMVRSVRRRSSDDRRTAAAWRILDRRPRRFGAERLFVAPSCSLRQCALS
jgi:hypothetical protein